MKTIKKLFQKLLDDDINKSSSIMLGLSGILANVAGMLICLIDGAPLGGKLTTCASLLFLLLYSWFCYKKKLFNIYSLTVSFAACNILFPFIFFNTGGIQKSFIFYFYIAAVAYGISMRKWWNAIFPLATILEYNLAIIISYMHHAPVNMFGAVRLSTLLLGFNVNFIFIFFFLYFFIGNTKRFYNELRKQVFHDELTKLYNRKKFNTDIKEKKFRFGIMMDIDNFHSVNEDYGHQYGDLVLQKLAEIALSFSCDEFKIYRYGGEEFFILSRLPFHRTYKNLRDIQAIFQKDLNQTLSIGITAKLDYDHYQQVIKRTDENMYFVKNNGKNNICYDGKMITDEIKKKS